MDLEGRRSTASCGTPTVFIRRNSSGVGADQNVLAVVQFVALRHDAARPPAGHRPDSNTVTGMPRPAKRHRSGHAGVTSADDRYR
jgi:hypothetical protein